MKFYIALFLGISISLACGAKPGNDPVMDIENPIRDAGTIIQGETIQQVFTITNKGSKMLEIVNVGHS